MQAGKSWGAIMSFWYPYNDPHEAALRLGVFADQHVGPICGITYSDGRQVALLRRPRTGGGHPATYLNVLCHRGIPAPVAKPHQAPPPGFMQQAEAFAWAVLKINHLAPEDLRADAEAIGAAATKVWRAGRDNIWEPAHRWMIDPRHKSYVDGLGVAMDVVGVIAGVGFFLAFSPALGAVAITTGVAAAVGSGLLLVADGLVWGTEVSGHKDWSEHLENSKAIQWMRIVGTIGALADVAVGGPRALKELQKLGREIDEGLEAAGAMEARMAAARARAGQIRRAHPDKANKLRHQANVIARDAAEHRAKLQQVARRGHLQAARDLGAGYGATPVGAGLFAGSPPSMLLTERQRHADEVFLHSMEAKLHPLEPHGGMPRDAHLEMRVSFLKRAR